MRLGNSYYSEQVFPDLGSNMQQDEQDNNKSLDNKAARPNVVLELAAQTAREVERWGRLAEGARTALAASDAVEKYAEDMTRTVDVARKALGLMVRSPFPKLPKLPKLPEPLPMPSPLRVPHASMTIPEPLDDVGADPDTPSSDSDEQEGEDYRPGTYL